MLEADFANTYFLVLVPRHVVEVRGAVGANQHAAASAVVPPPENLLEFAAANQTSFGLLVWNPLGHVSSHSGHG